MTQKELRDAHAEVLEGLGFDHFALTLTYNDSGIALDRIRSDLRHLRNHVDRLLIGPNFHRRPWDRRSQFWAVVQLLNDYPHIHLGWRMPDPDRIDFLEDVICSIWLTFARKGEYDLRDYERGWAGYATRDLTDPSHIILSAEFLR